MLSKLSLSILFLLLLSSLLNAKSILYKVASKSNTVYILGSIHLAKPELYPLNKAIEKAYASSDILVVELDPGSQHSLEVVQDVMNKEGIYPVGKSLKSELSPETYKMLDTYIQKCGLSLEVMEPMRPWTVMLQLSVMEMMRLGYSPELGIDQHFLQQAKRDKKTVSEIESAEEQMALLSKNDKAFQELMLRYTLESMHETELLLDKMFTSWKEGDAATLATVVDSSLVIDPRLTQVYDLLITQRNYKMAAAIEKFLQTEKVYFVVVGAGHVVGEEGIIALLRQAGYKIMQQ